MLRRTLQALPAAGDQSSQHRPRPGAQLHQRDMQREPKELPSLASAGCALAIGRARSAVHSAPTFGAVAQCSVAPRPCRTKTHTHAHARTHTRAHARKRKRTCTHAHTHVHARKRTHTHTHTHARPHARAHAGIIGGSSSSGKTMPPTSWRSRGRSWLWMVKIIMRGAIGTGRWPPTNFSHRSAIPAWNMWTSCWSQMCCKL